MVGFTYASFPSWFDFIVSIATNVAQFRPSYFPHMNHLQVIMEQDTWEAEVM